MKPFSHPLRSSFLVATAILALGCPKDEGPGKLFEEDGTWELDQFNLDGEGLITIDSDNRGASFLLKFNSKRKVVQAAMCGESEQDTPETSLCRLLTSQTNWFCRCYAYAFEEDQMVWREFMAGNEPPVVTFDDSMMMAPATSGADTDTDTDTGGGGGDTGAAAGGDTQIALSALANISSTYQFRPLPNTIWGSDGVISSYVMQQKAESLFDQVFEDPDGRTTCTPCVADL